MKGRPPAATPISQQAGTSDIPLAVWPCAQRTSQYQREGRYLPGSNRHPGKMLPALAKQAIEAYSDPGDVVVDPMCGIGTTLVEAIWLGRNAVGIELDSRWASLARDNVRHARSQGAPGRACVIIGDARKLPRLLTRPTPRRLLEKGAAAARLPYGGVDLVLTSPPYGCEVGEIDKRAWGSGGDLCPQGTRNYGRDRSNLGHARGQRYTAAMRDVYCACTRVVKPGGFVVAVTKDMRIRGAQRNLAGQTVALCEDAGLRYWQHVIALLATIRDGQLIPRPSFWQTTQTRRALAHGDRTHLVVHEDVLVFRRPEPQSAAGASRPTAARRAA